MFSQLLQSAIFALFHDRVPSLHLIDIVWSPSGFVQMVTDVSMAGQKMVIEADVGKEVVTCFGKPVGWIKSVSQDREVKLALLSEGAAYLSSVGQPCSAGSSVQLQPEDVAMVTETTVWLRL